MNLKKHIGLIEITRHTWSSEIICLKSAWLSSMIMSLCLIQALQAVAQKNYARIQTGDSYKEIVRKAASVVPSERQFRWQQLEVTGFIHFGINTFTNKEWGDGTEDPAIFNPADLNARQWIKVCKQAGIKQVILTAKHHDGFCLWPSKYTGHSVKNSPWKGGKGDVVKEVSDACHEYGIGFGIYLSPWDRHSPFFGSDRYNEYFIQQLRELLTGYGEIDEVWFDGANGEGPNGKKQVYDFNRWYSLIRKLQPDATIAIMGPDIRWVGTESGYGRTSEWSVVPAVARQQDNIAENSQKEISFKPANVTDHDLGSREKIMKAKNLIWFPAEMDVSIRPGWFYHPEEDLNVKTPARLLDIYYGSVGRNGVLLLNIPPDTRGHIHENDINTLREWKNILDNTFSENLLKGATIISRNGKNKKAMLDGNYASHWITKKNDTTAIIEFKLPSVQTFDVLMVQEDIRTGQRIEKFVMEWRNGDVWTKAAEGTTVGYKRLLKFSPVTAKAIRLRIESSRWNPAISEIGLYKQALLKQ